VLDASGNPVLPPSTQVTLGGAKVCIIGAVTQETPTLVTPAGIAGLTFTDPVAAVNKEVARLEAASVDCDATIANYHEGAPQPGTAATQAQQEAASAAFRNIAQNTAAAVDVIYNGHTHQPYAYSGTRPVMQTDPYGASVGDLDMKINTDTNTVSVDSARIVPRVAAANTALPRVAAVDAIVKAAQTAANVIGDRKVGTISADVTRADADLATPGIQEDRKAESTIGNMVADALREVKIPAATKTPTIGITNPGGLRADLLYKGDLTTSPENADGVVTFEEANSVLPFVNNINYVDVTGATLKKIFEQQWQPASASNAFLHLGVSKNVQTVLDPSRPLGDRVTSITVDGQPVVPAKTYTVSTFSFLAQGGDNFGAFKEGKAIDTGAIDRDLWINGFFGNGTTKSPSAIKRQIFATGLTDTYRAGDKVEVVFDKLDITSAGIAPNTRLDLVKVNKDGSTKVFATVPVTAGKARAVFTVRGSKELRFVAQGSTTTVARDVVKTKPVLAHKLFPKKASKIEAKKTRVRLKVKVKSAVDLAAKGRITVKVAGRKYNAKVKDGVAKVKLRTFAEPGKYKTVVKFRANSTFKGAKDSFKIRVTR
jgi:5'-nucleotidase